MHQNYLTYSDTHIINDSMTLKKVIFFTLTNNSNFEICFFNKSKD